MGPMSGLVVARRRKWCSSAHGSSCWGDSFRSGSGVGLLRERASQRKDARHIANYRLDAPWVVVFRHPSSPASTSPTLPEIREALCKL